MACRVIIALFAFVEASLFQRHHDAHCYEGHGGTPIDTQDTPVSNVSEAECEAVCENATKCVGFSRYRDHHSEHGDCYLRTALNLTQCAYSRWSGWDTYTRATPPPLQGNIVYHLFEPKYTGLTDKDGGDFKGDSGFIFGTFNRWEKGNPEASMQHNILEMSEVNVTGWGRYEECNAPGAVGQFTCPENQTEYCCTTHDPKNHSHNIPANHTRTQLPGIELNKFSLGPQYGFPGFWFSFPKESQNVTWTERVLRRIAGKCLGDAWRMDAGGCDQCGEDLDSCVADCIQAALCVNGSTVLLQATWDRVFANASECPDVPFPDDSAIFI